MKPVRLETLLQNNAYPGRGMVLGKSHDGQMVVAYFIMGRSENSRNRMFEPTEDGIRTKAYDESKVTDPSLILYHPVRYWQGHTIVTNGDQTDTIWQGLKQGQGMEQSLQSRTFEPDAPHYTPRISGLLHSNGAYALSILKTQAGNPDCCERFFYTYDTPVAGVGHWIHTYQGDGNPLCSFAGEPVRIALDQTMDTFAQTVWHSLHPENKIALYVQYTNLQTGATQTRIYNRQGEQNA